MDASAFWGVIGKYNLNTSIYQIVLLSLLVAGILASYLSKYKWIAKAVLGVLEPVYSTFLFPAVLDRAYSEVFCLAIILGQRNIVHL